MQQKATTGSEISNPSINLNDVPQVEHWCAQLGCSPFELRNVVLSQGPSYIAVKTYLQGARAAVPKAARALGSVAR